MNKSPDIICFDVKVILSYCVSVHRGTELTRLGKHIRLLQNKMADRDEGTFMRNKICVCTV